MPQVQIYYYVFLSILSLSAFYIFQKYREVLEKSVVRVKKRRYAQVQELIKSSISNQVNSLMVKSGLPFSAYQYQIIRYTICAVWMALVIAAGVLQPGGVQIKQLLLCTTIFVVTSPKTTVLKWRTPFKVVIDAIIETYRVKQNAEIYRAILQLKNIAITKEKNPPGGLFILEQIQKFTKTTRPIFNRMISLWSLGKIEEACEYFRKAIPTKEANDISTLFEKLDSINPYELKGQLQLFQKVISEHRKTQRMTFNQRRGYILTSVIAITMVIGMFNFVVVVYFIDTMKSLKGI